MSKREERSKMTATLLLSAMVSLSGKSLDQILTEAEEWDSIKSPQEVSTEPNKK